MHRGAFTHRRVYTEKPLHRGAFAHRSLLRTEPFAQSSFYTAKSYTDYTERLSGTDAFTQRNLYTEEPLRTDAFTQRSLYTEELLHLYAQMRSHTGGFTIGQLYGAQNFYIEQLLRSEACNTGELFLHRSFDIRLF